jgi:segregation and condensation protein B
LEALDAANATLEANESEPEAVAEAVAELTAESEPDAELEPDAPPEAPEFDAPNVALEALDAANATLEANESEPEAVAEADIEPAPEAEIAAPAPAAEPEPEPELAETDAPNGALGALNATNAPLGEKQGGLEAEPEGDEDEGIATSDLPDLTEDLALHAALEALLLVTDGPAEEEILADALGQPVKRIRQALNDLAAFYHETNRGIDLRNVGGGWRFHTRDRFAPFVEKLLLGGQRAKLTRAALESLAVIAYRQPVTRARVAAVRGVNVDGVIRTLVTRGLIEETGTDKETGGILYRTTELFLERLGLSSLEDLPPIAPLLPEVDAIDDV